MFKLIGLCLFHSSFDSTFFTFRVITHRNVVVIDFMGVYFGDSNRKTLKATFFSASRQALHNIIQLGVVSMPC